MFDYAHPESLASTQWLADHLDDPQTRLVEVVWGASPSFGMPAYESGHIPGAVAWDFQQDLQDPARGDILDKMGLEALLSRSGITPETTIIVYSGFKQSAGDLRLLAAENLWTQTCPAAGWWSADVA